MFALCAAGGRNLIQVNIMTETLPVYHADDPDKNAAAIMAETQRAMRYRALDDAGATERALLTTISQELGDLRQCAEALGVGL